MSGYMTKLQSYMYEGEWTNGTGDSVPNGMIMVQGTGANADKLVLPAADSTTKFICKEVTTIYDQVGYRFIVDKLNKRYYFVENGMDDFNDMAEYDNQNYVTKDGELLRAHPLLVGDEFIVSGDQTIQNQYAVGTTYGVLADGTIG